MRSIKRLSVWLLLAFNWRSRIRSYRVSALVVIGLAALVLFGTGTALAANDCVSNGTGGGNWNSSSTWSGCGGGTPGASDNVFIQSGDTVTLTQTEIVNDVNVSTGTTNATTGAEGLLALGSNTLQVNGKLRCYFATVGTTPGTSTTTIGPGNITITASSAGKLSFVGNSRNITNTGEWSANNTGSATSFAVEINLNSGQTATMQTTVKASSWSIMAGTLDAGTFTISADNGTTGQADIAIATGATLVSTASSTGTHVFQRTGSTRAGTLTVNGTLTLSGASPSIAMNAITLNGTVEYSRSGIQTLATADSSGADLSTYTNLTLSGSGAKTLGVNTTVNGILKRAGTNASLSLGVFTLTYGATATLEYAASLAQTSADAEFPSSGGPTNLTINNSNGVTIHAARTVNGTLLLVAGSITNGNNLTLNGTIQINGGNFGSAPTYGSSSTLIYNTTYGVFNEWTAGTSVGSGVPKNVTIQAGTITLPTSDRTVPGDLSITGGSLVLNATSGDIKVGGNWTRGGSGTFTPNDRAVFFNGTGTQILSVTGGGTETFNYLLIDKTTGNVQLNSSPATDGTVNGTSGNTLQVLNTGGIDLNGRTLTMSGSGGNLLVSGGARTITGASGSIFSFTGAKTVTSASGGALTFDDNVLVKISAGVGFNNSTTTIKNILQIDSSGFVTSGSAPTYGAASTLKYNSGASYGANEEWYPNTTSGAGVPQNVQVSNNTALNLGSTTFARTMKGTLTIDPGASLTLSSGSGGNLNVAGDFANSGTFTHNSRTVIFNGSGTQNLTANNPTTFNNLTVNTGVTLVETVSADYVTVSGTLTNNGTIRKSQSVNGTGAKTFGLAGSFNGANLTIDVTTQGSLSNLRVDRVDSNHPYAGTPQQTGRYWSITPTNGGYAANLTLPRNNAGMPSVCRYSGSGTLWNCASAGSTSNTVTGNGIASFSEWAVGNDAPTAAELIRFKAKLTPKNKVQVRWKTGAELKVLGFNLYRQGRGQKGWVKVNAKQIDAIHLGTPEGALYKFTDKKVQPGKTYRYKLEIITLSGSEWSDPVKIAVP